MVGADHKAQDGFIFMELLVFFKTNYAGFLSFLEESFSGEIQLSLLWKR